MAPAAAAPGGRARPLYLSAEPSDGSQGTRLVPLRRARVLDAAGAEVDFARPGFAGKVLELQLEGVEGGAAAAAAAGDAEGAWEARLAAVLTGAANGADGKGGAPETVWRLRGMRDDRGVPCGGRTVQWAIKEWVEVKKREAARASSTTGGGG